MHVFGAFELDIRPGTPDHPAGVKIALLRYARGEDSRLFITPECASLGRTGRDPRQSQSSLPGGLTARSSDLRYRILQPGLVLSEEVVPPAILKMEAAM